MPRPIRTRQSGKPSGNEAVPAGGRSHRRRTANSLRRPLVDRGEFSFDALGHFGFGEEGQRRTCDPIPSGLVERVLHALTRSLVDSLRP